MRSAARPSRQRGLWFDTWGRTPDRPGALQLFWFAVSAAVTSRPCATGRIDRLGACGNNLPGRIKSDPALRHAGRGRLVARVTVHGDKGSVIKARADQQGEPAAWRRVDRAAPTWARMTTRWWFICCDASLQARWSRPAGRSAPPGARSWRCAEGPDLRQSGAAVALGDGPFWCGGALAESGMVQTDWPVRTTSCNTLR